LELPNETPLFIREILDEISRDPSQRIKDWDLTKRGLEPSTIRRWFTKNHGITFQAYQRMFRINSAFKKIQNGDSVTSAAFDTGYESLSGFQDSFRSVFGVSPSNGKKKQVIDVMRIESPLGTMFACGVEQGICLLEFSDRKMLETEFKALSTQLNATIVQGDNPHFSILEVQLKEYFEGSRKEFTVPLFLAGTDFQRSAWESLQRIPYGTTRSYQQQAVDVKRPGAVRAVANANGMNRIAIIIPCHRVIGSDGHLTGYGGGLWRKKWLLDFELEHAGKGSYQPSLPGF
jgi:AraC family transcriptional regulator of adaptative response/methylated-DNA-[protein]-cysteine methyltransferase